MSAPELQIDPDATVLDPGLHFTADMDVASLLLTRERCLLRAPLTDAVRAPGGGASVGMLMTLMDVGSSNPALVACAGDWTATQDLSVHRAAGITDGPIVLDNRLVRVGTKVIIVGVDIYDGRGEDDFDALHDAVDHGTGLDLAATGLVTFARIPRSAARNIEGYDPANWLGEVRHRTLNATPTGTMYERMGLEVVDADAGGVQLERTSYVINSIGTINGGALTVLAEAAAETLRPGLVAADMQIHYLSQVKAGPARTHGAVVRDAHDHSVVSVEIVDHGNEDALLALATVTLQRPAG